MEHSEPCVSGVSDKSPSPRYVLPSRGLVVVLLTSLLAAIILACASVATPEQKASVLINAPTAGTALTLGQDVEVNVSAADPAGIVEVELWVDGQMVASASTPNGQPQTNTVAVLAWKTDGVGLRKLQARSVNSKQETLTSAAVEVAVRQAAAPSPISTPAATPIPILPTPLPTPTSCTPMVIVQTKALNVRSGPGTTYSTLGRLQADETAQVVGRNAAGTWWQIRFGTAYGWVSGSYVIPSCTDNVPIAGEPTPAPTPTPLPGINFWADNPTIATGQCTTIRWQVTNAAAVYLNEGGADQGVAGQGSKTVCPAAAMTYRLIVILTNNQRIERQITVTVQGQGLNISLRADNTKLREGDCTILRWDVDGAKSVYISDGKQEGSVSARGSAQICPRETVTYRLRAVRWDNYQERRDLQIKVEKGPGSIDFWADRLDINRGECTVLRWRVTNPKRVFLNQGQEEQQVTAEGSTQVCPPDTNTYALRVEWQNGQQSQDGLTITVHQSQPPPVVQFSANPPDIHVGESSTLVWSVQNGRNAYLDGNAVPAQGSRQVTPQRDTTYVLRVIGLDGSSSEYRTAVRIILAIVTPTIRISANPTEIESGDCSTLTWSSSHGQEFYINNEPVGQSGSMQVCPPTTTDYTFRVTTLGTMDAYQTVRVNVWQPEPTLPLPPAPVPEPTEFIIGPGGLPPTEEPIGPLVRPGVRPE